MFFEIIKDMLFIHLINSMPGDDKQYNYNEGSNYTNMYFYPNLKDIIEWHI